MNVSTGRSATAATGSIAPVGPFRLIVLLLVYVASWLLLTPYAGLSHDAQAYAFQALARLDPGVLG